MHLPSERANEKQLHRKPARRKMGKAFVQCVCIDPSAFWSPVRIFIFEWNCLDSCDIERRIFDCVSTLLRNLLRNLVRLSEEGVREGQRKKNLRNLKSFYDSFFPLSSHPANQPTGDLNAQMLLLWNVSR